MTIFQKSVIKKHLNNLDKEQVENAYQKFRVNYSQAKIFKIKLLKEEEYQDGFLREIFVDVFGYTLKPAENYNLVREFKNQTDGKKADGAILKDGNAIVVIELKSTKTKDLKSITEQAFNYKNNQPDCKYVITSNFQKLRFYIDYTNEYEEFDLFNLQKQEFELLYLILHKDNILSDLPLKLKTETKFHEENISDKLYKDYSNYKHKIYNNLVKNNHQYDKLTLFKKSQKFLDRLLFVFFSEDTGLVPPNAIFKIVEQWETLKELDEYKTLYSRFVKFFGHLDKGHKYKTYDLPAYNGGLFAPDEILDNVKIDDEILKDDALLLSSYDFSTDVDVNILGHIFEHSLGEIEEITAEISASRGHAPLALSKRKKDGVFYTPKYITQYIVENTVGKLCTEKREELNITEIEFDGTYKTKVGKLSEKGKKLFKTLESYKNWLITLKIIDPACGSGAFLNQALLFLIDEHKQIDDIIAELTGEAMRLFDTDKVILENNLYGVDINEESVEIARLSLWLRTAQKGRKLSNLNENIKCGNSLIDDPEIAGDKAFHWQTEFPQIFTKKNKKAWHITTATHNSRYSQRMFDNHVKLGEAVWMDEDDEIIITKTIAEIVKESKFDNNGAYPIEMLEYNICGDHMHLLLVCEEKELTKIVGKIKAMTSRAANIAAGRTVANVTRGHAPLSLRFVESDRGETQTKFWTQKFGKSEIKDESYLNNAIEYIRNNRVKHELPKSKEIEKIKQEFLCTVEHAYRTGYNGGFHVVIGNPPYGAKIPKDDFEFYTKKYETAHYKLDTFSLFIEKSIKILKKNKVLGLIVPYTWLTIQQHSKLRKYILDYNLQQIIDLPSKIFADADLDTVISIVRKDRLGHEIKIGKIFSNEIKLTNILSYKNIQSSTNLLINVNLTNTDYEILDKIKKSDKLTDFFEASQGYIPYRRSDLIIEYGKDEGNKIVDERLWHSSKRISDDFKQEIQGKDLSRYSYSESFQYIKYGKHLAGYVDPKYFKSARILIMEVTRGNSHVLKSCFVEKEYYNTPSIINIISKNNDNELLKYLISTINSSLFSWYHKKVHPKANAITSIPKILVNDIRNLPFKNIEEESKQPFIEKANKMLDLNKSLQQKKSKFINRLTDNFEIDKLSKKIDAFYNFDFKTLVSELKKKKVALSLLQQDEWEEYFNPYKTEINNLQTQISKTDKEIDQMVYQLYELTNEEIKIVEESVK